MATERIVVRKVWDQPPDLIGLIVGIEGHPEWDPVSSWDIEADTNQADLEAFVGELIADASEEIGTDLSGLPIEWTDETSR
jgi:hypothetical protein